MGGTRRKWVNEKVRSKRMGYYFMKNIAPKINEAVKKKVEENQVKKEEKKRKESKKK